ncbi:MAG: hypothetical protein KAI55_00535 [Candidatus Aenigmarchaeota archaeon]|nr:hypothetical protein [Candidatus Aenigmarchaeota archaeon]
MKKIILILCIISIVVLVVLMGYNSNTQKMISISDDSEESCNKWCNEGVDSWIDDSLGKTKTTLKASEICEC